MIGMVSLASCAGEETVNLGGPEQAEYRLGVDQAEDDYRLTVFNMKSGGLAMARVNEDGNMERIDVVSNRYAGEMSVAFNEDGQVSNIAVDSLTIVFDNYAEGKVDLVYLYKDYVYTVKEVAFDPATVRAATKAGGEPVKVLTKGMILDADRWLIEHEQLIKSFFLVTDQALGIGRTAIAGHRDMPDEMKKAITDQAKDLFMDTMDITAGDNTWANLIGYADDAADLFVTFRNGSVLWTYSALKTLLTNYSDYSQFCENAFYALFEKIDEWNRPNVEAGHGILQTGSGSLKVTLSWSFYADIDLHVIEPNGNRIYYIDRTSSTGGYLDRDDRDGGSGAVENIYWENAPDGTYTIVLDYFGRSASHSMSQSGVCKVTLLCNGNGRVINVPMSEHDTKTVVQLKMPEGQVMPVETKSAGTDLIGPKVPKD